MPLIQHFTSSTGIVTFVDTKANVHSRPARITDIKIVDFTGLSDSVKCDLKQQIINDIRSHTK